MRRLCSAIVLLASALMSGQTDLLSTQRGTAVPANTWTQLPYSYTAGVVPSTNAYAVTGFDKAFYVPALDRMCHLGNYREPSSEPNRAWLCYSFAENNIAVVAVGSTFHDEHMPEGGHPVGAINVDPATSVAYGPCCFSGSQVSDTPHVGAYLYDFIGGVGRNRQSATALAWYTQLMTGSFDPIAGVLVSYGGQNGVQNTSLYDPATNRWTINLPVHGTPPPSGITEASMAWNANDGKLYLFGGRNGETLNNRVYRFDVAKRTWEALARSDPAPAPRYAAGWAYSGAENAFLTYSGYGPGGAVLNDAWIFDVASERWTQVASSPAALTSAPYERLAYFPTENVFVVINATAAGPQIWAYRHRGRGSKAGRQPASYSASPGSINRNATGAPSWAQGGSIAASPTSTYLGWSETGGPADLTEAMWLRPYVDEWTGGALTKLGASYSALSGGSGMQSHDVSMAVSGNTPWACWHEQSVNTSAVIECKGWDGNSWSRGGEIGKVGKIVLQGPVQIVDVHGAPTLIFSENNRDSGLPIPTYAYVKQWNGSSFVTLGSALNTSTGGTTADSIAIASDGNAPYAAFTEYVLTPVANPPSLNSSAPQVYLKLWNGTSWQTQCGGSGNIDRSHRAYSVSLTYTAGAPYIAFVERSDAGNTMLYVRKCQAGSWSTVGSGPLNRDEQVGWAFRPELIAGTTNLYIVWDEQTAYAAPDRIFAAKWDGKTWTSLGGALNADTVAGSATHPTITLAGTTPTVLWGEVKFGSMRQMYVRQWNGKDWITPAASDVAKRAQ